MFAGEVVRVAAGYADAVVPLKLDPAEALQTWPRVWAYTTKPGDTLEAIAREFYTTPNAIIALSELSGEDPQPLPVPGAGARGAGGWGAALEAHLITPSPSQRG